MYLANKQKISALIVAVLMITSIAFVAIPIKPETVQAQLVGSVGTSPSTAAGYPNLGPLPAGVTPRMHI